MENEVKKCNKCSIMLTPENKTTFRPICKGCKSAYDAEYRKNKKLKDLQNINNDVQQKCNKCSIIITPENKIIGNPTCRACTNLAKQKSTRAKILRDAVDTTEKKCSVCSIVLTNENRSIGRTTCKECKNEKYKLYVETKLSVQHSENKDMKCNKCSILLTEEIKVPNRPVCRDCHNNKCKEYKINNQEIISANNKKYYDENKEKIAEYYKDHYQVNKDTYMENNKEWRNNNREHIRTKENEKFRSDPIARLKRNCRTRIHSALNSHKLRSLKLIDCDTDFLKDWLQYNFKEGMTLDNYGTYWHVDHVIPCAKFNLEIDDEIKHCFRWTNLQPLEASENISKQAKINETEITEHYNKVKCYATAKNIKIEPFDFTKYF